MKHLVPARRRKALDVEESARAGKFPAYPRLSRLGVAVEGRSRGGLKVGARQVRRLECGCDHYRGGKSSLSARAGSFES